MSQYDCERVPVSVCRVVLFQERDDAMKEWRAIKGIVLEKLVVITNNSRCILICERESC